MRIPRPRRPLRRRSVPPRQLAFGFLEGRLRRERHFKRGILLATSLALALILGMSPWAPYFVASLGMSTRSAARTALGLPPSRAEIDESRRDLRRLEIDQTRPRVEKFFAESGPALQALLRYAGMDPEHGLLRWGNVHWTLLLSSKVFEPDDDGRSYRLRPGVRSIWLRTPTISAGTPAFFLVPDGPGLADAVRGAAVPLEASRQLTNSWGLRGPEPEPDAPLRGIVLGDSFMQGMFLGDDETPPECLRRHLQRSLATRASILNAGVMGYSPEQYYHSLTAFSARFQPQFVVVSLFANDFGDHVDATGRGVADWKEGKYWLEKIAAHCRDRSRPCLVVAVPYKPHVLGRRRPGHYPGAIANILDVPSATFLDPLEDFLDAHLRSQNEGKRQGRPPRGCALYNEALDDDHFSAAGAELWAESVGRRLVLLLEDGRLGRVRPAPGGRVLGPGSGASAPAIRSPQRTPDESGR